MGIRQIVFLVSLLGFGVAFGQQTRYHQSLATWHPIDSTKGYYLPAFDTIRSLAIFVSYQEGALNSDAWPLTSKEVPSFGKKLLATSLDSMDPDSSLTGYFLEASMGRLKFLGTHYPEVVHLDHNLNYYGSHGQMADIVYEVLDKVTQSGKVNWQDYDLWGKVNGKWRKQPDGVVDNILVIFRDDPYTLGYYNWQGTGGGIAALLCKDYKVNDHLVISGASMGSGVIANAGAEIFPRYFKLVKHELAHYFTLDHYAGLNGFWGADFTNHGAWGLAAAHGSSSICVNSWDRDVLGWSNFLIKLDARTAKDTVIELHDFITTGEAAKIRLPYVADEYFLLEYHNNKGWFDEVDQKQDGLYILHESGLPENHLDCEEADGRWDFVMSDSLKSYELCCGEQPMVKRLNPNPLLGFGDRDDIRVLKDKHAPDGTKLTLDNIQRALAFSIEGEEHMIHCNGDGHDGFTLEPGRNEFSICTNPSSASNGTRRISPTSEINGIQVKVIKMEKDKVTVQIRFRYFHIARDTRWTGDIVIHDPLVIDKGRQLLINRSVTFNGMYKPLPKTNVVLKDGASITIEKNARLFIDDHVTLVLSGKAKIYVKEGGVLIVKNGSRIIGDVSHIVKHPGARVVYK